MGHNDKRKKVKHSLTFRDVAAALLDPERSLPDVYLVKLSDLDPADLDKLRQLWPNIPLERRIMALEQMVWLVEEDYRLSFQDVALLALEDHEARPRLLALNILSQFEDSDLLPRFLDLLTQDPAPEVRAAAARVLGTYIYSGEMEDLDEEALHGVEEALFAALNGADNALVRRFALQSLGFSSRPEVPALIETALAQPDPNWRASALLAMGRSADEAWAPKVLAALDEPVAVVRAEAARAAGELELAAAVPVLLGFLEDDDEPEVRAASIWSLSQIGGEGVREALEELAEETEDDDEADLLADALDNLDMTEEMAPMMLHLKQSDEEDLFEFDMAEEDEDEEDEDMSPPAEPGPMG